jgi:hypothetical protein
MTTHSCLIEQQPLSVAGTDNKAGVQFLDRPGWRETAGGLFNFVGSFGNRLLVCIREIE